MSFDVLQKKIIRVKSPTVVKLDPEPEYVPEHIRKASYEQFGEILEGTTDAVSRLSESLIGTLCDAVLVIKPQSVCHERLGWHGMAALEETICYAHEKSIYVIADIKQGNTDSTTETCASAWLGVTEVGEAPYGGFNAGYVTLNDYMGADSVNPFLKVAGERDKSMPILAETSSPGSGELQNIVVGEGDTVYSLMAGLIEKWGAGAEGKYGYTRAGTVVGATYPEELQKLRTRMPHTFLLVFGYRVQGGTAEDVQYAFQDKGRDAIVNSSQDVICAWQKMGKNDTDHQEAARVTVIAMRDDICRFIVIQQTKETEGDTPMPAQKLYTIAEAVRPNEFACSLTLEAEGMEPRGLDQFVHVKCGHSRLLRRPISIRNWRENRLRIILEVRGEGTEWLACRKAGDTLDALGPLGCGF